ncbi:ABC transporter ATP-binding protein [Pseudooceanicola sp. 200-1SW]|uniref:ABC transporter ATP-binding protein n=1 Tax=Pseudooceanicola sp. 200-1SW TaxID=3425949 RepID=UPI003D7F3AF7
MTDPVLPPDFPAPDLLAPALLAASAGGAAPLLSVRDLAVRFDTLGGPLQAVRGVSLDIRPGETLALVGESGSGKSAFARALLQMNQPPFTTNRTHIQGQATLTLAGSRTDLVGAAPEALNAVRARQVAMVFQDALSALNPVLRIGAQLAEALAAAHPGLGRAEARARCLRMLEEVGIRDPQARLRHYPHQLSGGQRQRVMIAMAMIREPALLIADEPTTALDVTVQARILTLLRRLREARGLAMLFVTHDLGVVERIADRVAVMYAGQVVETGPMARVFAAPRHPYTAGLLASRPGHRHRGEGLRGTAPDARHLPPGCAFAPRCPRAGADCARPPALLDGVRCIRPQT